MLTDLTIFGDDTWKRILLENIRVKSAYWYAYKVWELKNINIEWKYIRMSIL